MDLIAEAIVAILILPVILVAAIIAAVLFAVVAYIYVIMALLSELYRFATARWRPPLPPLKPLGDGTVNDDFDEEA